MKRVRKQKNRDRVKERSMDRKVRGGAGRERKGEGKREATPPPTQSLNPVLSM